MHSRVVPALAATALWLAPRPALALEPTKVDVLFVIDNSGSMTDEQASLAANFPRFMDELAMLPGGLPDLHVAVVSTNMGAGHSGLTNCSETGDHGLFQHEARLATCSPPTDSFIIDQPGGDDASRTRNYPGTLADSFSCIARLGAMGCGFEQPLAALERALDGSNPENAGFLRADAYLAVVVISDEDDCSATDPDGAFDIQASSPLGPLTSFRCARLGVSCDGAPIGEGPATYASCTPNFESEYLVNPQATVDFVNGLKSDPSQLLIAAIVGNAGPVSVVRDTNGEAELVKSCAGDDTELGGADPAVRTTWFAAQFATHDVHSICDSDLSGALSSIGRTFRSAIVANDSHDATVEKSGCAVSPGAGGRSLAGLLLLALLALALSSRRARS